MKNQNSQKVLHTTHTKMFELNQIVIIFFFFSSSSSSLYCYFCTQYSKSSNTYQIFRFIGTDATLLMKLNANHGNKSIFVKPFSDYAVSFGIRHFAGVVMYYSKCKERSQNKIIRLLICTCVDFNLPISFTTKKEENIGIFLRQQFMSNFNRC